MKTLLSFTLIMAGLIVLSGQIVVGQNLAAPYLQFSTSAVGSSYGNAYTSLAEDASATYWNPAGLTAVKTFSFVGMSSMQLGLDRQFNAASLAFDMKRFGAFAISFVQSGVNNIQGYDENGEKTSTFNVVNLVPGVSYAVRPTPELSVGGTIRYIRQNLDVQVDNGYSLDTGIRYHTAVSGRALYTGLVVQNLFGKLGVTQLPQLMRLGVGTNLMGTFKAGLDYVIEDLGDSKSRKYFNVGVGYEANMDGIILAARTGFQNNQDLTAGAGVGMVLGTMQLRIDYAYVTEPSALFTNSHRLGVTLSGH